MPKSKRDRKVSLTQAKKKGRANKERLVQGIRECVEAYENVFVFDVENMRNRGFQELREQWGGSRFYFGKNKVMAAALGRTPQDELRTGLYKMSELITGSRGLLFTNSTKEQVIDFFSSFSEENFARAGCIASVSFSLSKGPLPVDLCPHPMEPMLRKLGLPTRMNNAIIDLMDDTLVCREGDILTPEQCRILEIFQQKLATFRVHIIAYWSAKSADGQVEMLDDWENPRAGLDGSSSKKTKADGEVEGDDEDDEDEDGDDEFEMGNPKWGDVPVPTFD